MAATNGSARGEGNRSKRSTASAKRSSAQSQASELAAMREALQHTLVSHNNKGRAQLCTCSLCVMIRAALKPGGGADYANRIRQECIHVVEWRIRELEAMRERPETLTAVREVADLLRVLTLPLPL